MPKIHHLYFLWLLCIVNNTVGCMGNEDMYQHYNEKIFFPIVQLTHRINLCLHKAFLFTETDPTLDEAQQTIAECCEYMQQLITIIANDFDAFQRIKLKKIFMCMKKEAPKKEQDIITTQVFNTLKWPHSTATHDLGNSIASSLQVIQKKLSELNIYSITSQEYRNRLQIIQEEYTTFLATLDFNNYQQKFFYPKKKINRTIEVFTNRLTTPELERKKLFSKKKYLEKKLENKPYALTSPLQSISTKAHMLSWVPFLDTKYVIRKIIIMFAGQEGYDELKKNSYFKTFRLLHKKNIIRLTSLFTNVHALLETRPARFIIDMQEGFPFVEHSCDLQEYFFIGLCAEINRAHHNSLKMINREKPFSFILGKKNKIDDDTQIQSEKLSIETADSIMIMQENFSIGIIDPLIKTLESIPTDLNAIKTTSYTIAASACNIARSFASSMVPWYTPEMQPLAYLGNNQIQLPVSHPKPISSEIITGNIKDFLSNILVLGPDLINAHQQHSHESQVNAFLKIVDVHTELARNTNIQYRLYQARNKGLPASLNELSFKIDTLYNSCVQLNETKKQLGFFNIWSKIANFIERNNTMKLLQKHIDIYNQIKINIYAKDSPYYDGVSYQFNPDRTYTQDQYEPGRYGNFYTTSNPYEKVRAEFAKNCVFSHADNIDLLKETTKNKSPFKQYANVFNPLEQAELRYHIK